VQRRRRARQDAPGCELWLKAVQPCAYGSTTIPGQEPITFPNLIERDFNPASSGPGERLVGDITYLRTGEGWLYLAIVIDLTTRTVVGWQLAAHMRTSLVLDALAMAIDAGPVQPDAIFRSDRGSQYTSAEFARSCGANGCAPASGAPGTAGTTRPPRASSRP
jgi:putative transposase